VRLTHVVAATIVTPAVLLLGGCSLFIPPSGSDLAGTYTHADTYPGVDTSLVMNHDGTCAVTNFPVEIDPDDNGDAVISPEHFDATCTWSVTRLLYSGAWELDFEVDPPSENFLSLD
jgi:hypothetical protein